MITAEQIEKINNYYDLTLNGKEIILKTKKNNKVTRISIHGEMIYFDFGVVKHITSGEQIKKLMKEGKAYFFKITNFLKDYFNLTDEQIFELLTGQDQRTREALKKEIENIGLTAYYITEEVSKVNEIDEIDICCGDTDKELYGWTEEKEFIAQLITKCASNEYYVEVYKFKSIPSQETLDMARLIRRFTQLLRYDFIKTKYHKLIHGINTPGKRIQEEKLTHWLDRVGANITEKMQYAIIEQDCRA